MFTLYKIYYGDTLAYLGRTRQPLDRRLHGHFFKKKLHKAVDLLRVSRIECAQFNSCADMYLYEIYYINTLRPLLNKDDVAGDKLTVTLPEVEFHPHECGLMDKWKMQVIELQMAEMEKRRRQRLRRQNAAKKKAAGEP